MPLSSGFVVLAERLQEAAAAMCHSDIRSRLQGGLTAALPNKWADVTHVFGDENEGHVVYRDGDKFRKATYKMAKDGKKHSVAIDHEAAQDVMPRTVFDLPGDGKAKESGTADPTEETAIEAAEVELSGDLVPLREGAVGQDGTAYLKLIAPGWGSSGYYSKEMLKRDGPTVFKAGTKNFWNHQTDAEEKARPEGDLNDLASVLTEDAKWMESGPNGAGLYAKAKVFEKYRQPVDDLAKDIGVSIRASGMAKDGKAEGRSGPIIEKLTRCQSVDYVTAPGAGGKVLQLFEAARIAAKPTQGVVEMPLDEAAFAALKESNDGLLAKYRKMQERLSLAEAGRAIATIFGAITATEAIKTRVTGRLLAGSIKLTEAGELDLVDLKTRAEAELKEEVAYIQTLGGGALVVGMGAPSQAAAPTAEQLAEAEATRVAEAGNFSSLMGFGNDATAAKKIYAEGRGSFDPNYNSGNKGGRIVHGTEVH